MIQVYLKTSSLSSTLPLHSCFMWLQPITSCVLGNEGPAPGNIGYRWLGGERREGKRGGKGLNGWEGRRPCKHPHWAYCKASYGFKLLSTPPPMVLTLWVTGRALEFWKRAKISLFKWFFLLTFNCETPWLVLYFHCTQLFHYSKLVGEGSVINGATPSSCYPFVNRLCQTIG